MLNVKKKVKFEMDLPWKSKLSFVKHKLKKKWRFWRIFKRYFLGRKKKNFFYKLKWAFNQKRILWHQLLALYGKKIKQSVYSKNQTKIMFGSRFFNSLSFLELRLCVLVMRVRFAFKVIEGSKLVDLGLVRVNGSKKTKNYIVRLGDILKREYSSNTIEKIVCYFFSKGLPFLPVLKQAVILKRQERLKWRGHLWNKWEKKNRNKTFKVKPVWFVRQNIFINYVETNYKVFVAILLSKPKVGDILLVNKKSMLCLNILRGSYLLY